MTFFWQLKKKEKTTWMLIFLAGFLLGIAAICLFSEGLVLQTGFLNASALDAVRYLDINRNGLFLYSLRQRMGMAAFLVLLSAAGIAGAGICLLLVWCGMSAGAVLTVLSMRYGMKGLLFFLSCILPQQFLLVPGYLLLMDWCFRRMERKKLLIPLAVVITGCLIESYVNPNILKVVLKFF
ncbi:MAG: stage II sporulation protein M [Eubacteriales bacterium]|nr:stage II sporulation protein M [Eubacteriales bacterium]